MKPTRVSSTPSHSYSKPSGTYAKLPTEPSKLDLKAPSSLSPIQGQKPPIVHVQQAQNLDDTTRTRARTGSQLHALTAQQKEDNQRLESVVTKISKKSSNDERNAWIGKGSIAKAFVVGGYTQFVRPILHSGVTTVDSVMGSFTSVVGVFDIRDVGKAYYGIKSNSERIAISEQAISRLQSQFGVSTSRLNPSTLEGKYSKILTHLETLMKKQQNPIEAGRKLEQLLEDFKELQEGPTKLDVTATKAFEEAFTLVKSKLTHEALMKNAVKKRNESIRKVVLGVVRVVGAVVSIAAIAGAIVASGGTAVLGLAITSLCLGVAKRLWSYYKKAVQESKVATNSSDLLSQKRELDFAITNLKTHAGRLLKGQKDEDEKAFLKNVVDWCTQTVLNATSKRTLEFVVSLADNIRNAEIPDELKAKLMGFTASLTALSEDVEGLFSLDNDQAKKSLRAQEDKLFFNALKSFTSGNTAEAWTLLSTQIADEKDTFGESTLVKDIAKMPLKNADVIARARDLFGGKAYDFKYIVPEIFTNPTLHEVVCTKYASTVFGEENPALNGQSAGPQLHFAAPAA